MAKTKTISCYLDIKHLLKPFHECLDEDYAQALAKFMQKSFKDKNLQGKHLIIT